MIKRAKFKQQEKRYRINSRIFASPLRVLDNEGKQVGVLSKDEALRLAQEQELDLVEIAPAAKPPVAKLIDFNKFLYQQAKKKQEEKKKAKTSETKEIRLGPFMSDNDLQVMIRRGREFLEDGDKIRLVVRFRGRQITRSEFGKSTIQKVVDALADISKIDREPHFEGRQLVAMLSVEKGKKHEETSSEESPTQTEK
ncbi:MAG TPA: translation initiation factor IF-3 [Candidatus Saccharimonadales bacterium]|nr:translation initiation factor IF-3 [Candidatus Saccharimonadales bacterium]